MRRMWSGLMALLVAVGVLVVVPGVAAAEAVTYRYYVTGTSTSVTPDRFGAGGMLGDVRRTSCITRAIVGAQAVGDYVYVADTCADGNPATAWVQWNSNGHAYHYYCINRLGAGTRVRCQFNWPEQGLISIAPGLLNVPTPSDQWQWGMFTHFRG